MSSKIDMKNFCPLPWTEVYIAHDTTGPCCINTELYNSTDVTDYLKSKELKTLKKEFLKGNKPESCRYCWDTEKAGMTSVRQSQTTKGSKLQRVSLAITNKCNFKCRMCNPVDSSAWGSDISATKILYGNRYDRKKEKFIKHKDDYASIDWIIDQCKKEKLLVNLLGGEPFISPGFLYFLEQVNKYNLYDNISLVITTNLSVTKYKRIDFIQELSKFKDLDIYASIDGCFKVGEYIRQGFDFKKFHTNLVAMKDLINFFSVTVQIYNVYDLPTIYKYADRMGIKINLNYLVEPDFLQISVLNRDQRNKILKYYESKNFYNKDLYTALSNNIDNSKLYDNYISYNNSLDKLWNKNIKDYIPELSALTLEI